MKLRTAWRYRPLKIAVSIVLLAALYFSADWAQVAKTLRGLDATWLAAGLLLFIPQTLLSAWRWRLLVRPVCAIGLVEAVRQTLAASALNLITPSKLGDLSKAAMLPGCDGPRQAQACVWVAIEKAADVAALASLLLLGCFGAELVVPACAIAAIFIWMRPKVTLGVTLASLALWSLHLAQIDLFLRAAGVTVPWTVSFARIPMAIFAGLLPISFCGLGTRDAALVWLFADVAPAATMAGVGVLTALRYLVPGVLGIPCLHWRPAQRVDVESISSLDDLQPA